MAVWEVVVQQSVSNVYLTNVYHVNEITFADARATALNIAQIHADALPTTFVVDAVRISNPEDDDGVFETIPLHLPGTREQTGQNLPLWNRFLPAFTVGPTFQLRKFLPGVTEGDQVDGTVVQSTLTDLQTNYIDPLVALGSVCNIYGTIVQSGVVKGAVAMRQLRRRKKRVTPVISPVG